MKCHRLNEVMELLHPVWEEHSGFKLSSIITETGG